MRNFSQLNICFLAGTLEHGGAEGQLFYMLQALCQGGAAPRVLCLDQGQFWEEPIRSLGLSVTWVGRRQSRLARLFSILRQLRMDPPDIFQSQHFFANTYVGLVSRLLHAGSIGAMRSEGKIDMLKNGPVWSQLHLRMPKLIAANSRLAMEHALAQGFPASRFHFLPNVIDTQKFKPSLPNTKIPLKVVAVGRVTKAKRFDRFISILSLLRGRLKAPVQGLIVGPFEQPGLRQELENQAAHLGLVPEGLEFTGGVSDMNTVYQQAAVCVLTSDYEGTPNVLLEAMASGLPVVSSRVGGIPKVIQHGKTGYLFDRDDLEGFVNGLAQLLEDPGLRTEMGRCARQFVEESHALERLPAYLGQLYELALLPRHHLKPLALGGSQA
jgi:glycosyltransferase involved in cell wall biosynthesis